MNDGKIMPSIVFGTIIATRNGEYFASGFPCCLNGGSSMMVSRKYFFLSFFRFKLQVFTVTRGFCKVYQTAFTCQQLKHMTLVWFLNCFL